MYTLQNPMNIISQAPPRSDTWVQHQDKPLRTTHCGYKKKIKISFNYSRSLSKYSLLVLPLANLVSILKTCIFPWAPLIVIPEFRAFSKPRSLPGMTLQTNKQNNHTNLIILQRKIYNQVYIFTRCIIQLYQEGPKCLSFY